MSLFLVYVILMPSAGRYDTGSISRPTSVDAGDYGLLGLRTWLDKAGIRTLSLKSRYNKLSDDTRLPRRGNLLITSLPHGLPARTRELESLHAWLAEGNYALILSAQYDRPDWANLGMLRFASADTDDVLEEFGFEFRYPKQEKQEDQAAAKPETEAAQNPAPSQESPGFFSRLLQEDPARKRLIPQRAPTMLLPQLRHSRTRAVTAVETTSYGFNGPPLTTAEDSLAMALGLLKNRETGDAVFWEATVGKGGFWLSAYPDLFGNLTLGRADNSKLLANLLAFGLQPDGSVVFDDFHFGISDLYDPQAFFADKRLHHTLLFILGFWILYLLGYSNRLGPPAAVARAPRASDFVETLGGLFARRLSALAVARGLIRQFYNEVRALYRLPENGQPVWDRLASRHARADNDLEQLRAMAEGCERGRAPKLHHLISTLQRIRKEPR